jgi:cytoskeletal protein RodZ
MVFVSMLVDMVRGARQEHEPSSNRTKETSTRTTQSTTTTSSIFSMTTRSLQEPTNTTNTNTGHPTTPMPVITNNENTVENSVYASSYGSSDTNCSRSPSPGNDNASHELWIGAALPDGRQRFYRVRSR